MSRKVKQQKVRKIRMTDKIGIGLVWLVLVGLWVTCIDHIVNGQYFGYSNYYGQPVGTFLLLTVLVIVTPIAAVMTYKTVRDKGIKTTRVPERMERPPWRFPWE